MPGLDHLVHPPQANGAAARLAGSIDATLINAVSAGGPTQAEELKLKTTAIAVYGVDLAAGTTSQMVLPGGKVTYALQLTNLVNIIDTLVITASENTWQAALSEAEFLLGPVRSPR